MTDLNTTTIKFRRPHLLQHGPFLSSLVPDDIALTFDCYEDHALTSVRREIQNGESHEPNAKEKKVHIVLAVKCRPII